MQKRKIKWILNANLNYCAVTALNWENQRQASAWLWQKVNFVGRKRYVLGMKTKRKNEENESVTTTLEIGAIGISWNQFIWIKN